MARTVTVPYQFETCLPNRDADSARMMGPRCHRREAITISSHKFCEANLPLRVAVLVTAAEGRTLGNGLGRPRRRLYTTVVNREQGKVVGPFDS